MSNTPLLCINSDSVKLFTFPGNSNFSYLSTIMASQSSGWPASHPPGHLYNGSHQ